MKRLFVLFYFIFLFFVQVSWAQETEQINAQVNEDNINAVIEDTVVPLVLSQEAIPADSSLSWLEKNKNEPFIALVNEYETMVKPDWSYEEKYHSRVKIQKEEGKELGQWPIYYNKSRDTITEVVARVENPDGRQYTADQIQDEAVYKDYPLYDDLHMKVVNLPDVEVGSIIDVTVRSISARKEIPNQYWAEVLVPAIPTQLAKHTYIFPEDKPIKFKSYKMDYKPTVSKSNGTVTYTIVFNETNPVPHVEEYAPPLQDVLGALYLSSMEDWKLIADWYRGLMVKNIVDDTDITLKTLEITKNKESLKDKALSIIEYVQDNFKQVPMSFGDNLVEPHPTNEIFKAKYGDSKDLTFLVKQMFKIVGIGSNVCLFSAEFAGNPQAGLPNASVFSHTILQASFGEEKIYIDPLLKGFSLGQYPSSYDNAYVFVIDEASFKFDNLPVGPEQDRTLSSVGDILINSDGSADFRVHVKLSPESSQSFRQSWSSSSTEDKNKFFDKLEQNFAKNGKLIDRSVKGVEDRYAPIEFDLRYQSPNAYPVINDMILIKEENQSDIPAFDAEKRQYPIFVPNNSIIKNDNIYRVPDGFQINFVPESYSISIDFMDVQVDYEKKDGEVRVLTNYKTKRSVVPEVRYGQVRDFRKDLFKNLDQYIILKKLSAIPQEAKDWVKNQ